MKFGTGMETWNPCYTYCLGKNGVSMWGCLPSCIHRYHDTHAQNEGGGGLCVCCIFQWHFRLNIDASAVYKQEPVMKGIQWLSDYQAIAASIGPAPNWHQLLVGWQHREQAELRITPCGKHDFHSSYCVIYTLIFTVEFFWLGSREVQRRCFPRFVALIRCSWPAEFLNLQKFILAMYVYFMAMDSCYKMHTCTSTFTRWEFPTESQVRKVCSLGRYPLVPYCRWPRTQHQTA